MTTLALCAGIGGLEPHRPAVAAETDAHARTVLEAHWPDTELIGDWTRLDDLDHWQPTLITAGLPCQPVSQAAAALADLLQPAQPALFDATGL